MFSADQYRSTEKEELTGGYWTGLTEGVEEKILSERIWMVVDTGSVKVAIVNASMPLRT